MEPWSVFSLILIIGLIFLLVATLIDNRIRRKKRAALFAESKQQIPNYQGASQQYVLAEDVLARPLKVQVPTPELLQRLIEAQKIGMHLDFGWASDRFVTHIKPPRAILSNPSVLIVDEVGIFRELITPLQRARQLGHPLVIVTSKMADATIDTLIANRVHFALGILVVQADPTQQHNLASALGICPVLRTDLQADWLTTQSLVTVKLWISQATHSIVVPNEINPKVSSES